MVQLALKWASLLEAEQAYAGFRIAASNSSPENGEKYYAELAQHLPGADIGTPFSMPWRMFMRAEGEKTCRFSLREARLKRADWLTMIADPFAEKLGGRKAIEEAMGEYPVMPYKGGLLLRAGDVPLLQGDMSPYKKVAGIIEPLRAKRKDGDPEGGAFGVTSYCFTVADYDRWFARFSPEPR